MHWVSKLVLLITIICSGFGAQACIGHSDLDSTEPEHDISCIWQVDEGKIDEVPIQYADDYETIELIGESVEISQLKGIFISCGTTAEQFLFDNNCILVEMTTDIEASADVTLKVDFWSDDIIDYEQKIPDSDGQVLQFLVPTPSSNSVYNARFIVRKDGKGRAILARIRIERSSGCSSAVYPRPKGYLCESDEECLSGSCGPTIPFGMHQCGECVSDQECEEGLICGVQLGDKPTPVPFPGVKWFVPTCVKSASKEYGQKCIQHEECLSGICDNRHQRSPFGATGKYECVECLEDADCDSEMVCNGEGECVECLEDADCDSRMVCKEKRNCVEPGIRPDGASCEYDSDCESASCIQPIDMNVRFGSICAKMCEYGRECDVASCIPKDAGYESICAKMCEYDSDCESGSCMISNYYSFYMDVGLKGICVKPGHFPFGAICKYDSHCESGSCDFFTCR